MLVQFRLGGLPGWSLRGCSPRAPHLAVRTVPAVRPSVPPARLLQPFTLVSPAPIPCRSSAVITNKADGVLWDVSSSVWEWGVGLLWSISRGWLLWDGLAFVNYYGMQLTG